MKKLTYSLLALLFCLPGNVHAQSIWDADHLADVKQSLDRPYYTVAYQQLKAEADRLLPVEPLSVMMKDKLPWPNPQPLHHNRALVAARY